MYVYDKFSLYISLSNINGETEFIRFFSEAFGDWALDICK